MEALRVGSAVEERPVPTIHHETLVPASIARVWMFFTDPVKNLPVISPPSSAVVIESADLPIQEGSKLTIAAKDPIGRRIRWESRIESFTPPHAVISGMEARFVDVQVTGPFVAWKHEHEFEAVDSKTTRVVDRITYRPPFGALRFVADWLLIRWQLRSMLKYRSKALRKAFGES